MDTLKPAALWIATIILQGELVGEYEATRIVTGEDADEAAYRAQLVESARQVGVQASGGMLHRIVRVSKVRRMPEAVR